VISKVNLLYGDGDILSGFLNVHSWYQGEPNDEIRIGDVKNLDYLVADSQLTELIATDVLDYLILGEAAPVMANWIKKLRHGGKIVVGGIDLLKVCQSFNDYAINLETANKLIHGSQDQPHKVRRFNLTLNGVADFLKEQGLKIMKRRYAGFQYLIEAERP
jgi:hypothetical protein